jgi:hypothetical protein
MVVKKNISIFFLITMLPAFVECKQVQKHDKDRTYPSPPGYQLNNPYVINLSTEMDEISGISFYPKDTSLFAICDDKGSLYKVHVKYKSKIEKWKFSKGNDYEDLVVADSTFYVLASDGSISAFNYKLKSPNIHAYENDLDGESEFETLYKDDATKKLILICKDCDVDTKGTITAYSFDPYTRAFSDTPFFTIDASEITSKLAKQKGKFKPSAAAVNPVSHELYIISSVNKALVVADTKGNVKEVYPLNPAVYKQPEGLTFTPSGDLIISNEQAEIGSANILIFKYKSAVK